MPSRPDSLETLKFSLELLRRIPKSRTVTASELQRQLADAGLKRDLRTVQRLLELFSEMYEIERDDRTKPYQYRWKERSTGLALPSLSPQECLLLALAERQLTTLLPARLMRSLAGLFGQAQSQIDSRSGADHERGWLAKVRVVQTTQPLLPAKVSPDVFREVSDALYADLWLELEYSNAVCKRTSAKVMPLGLAQQGQRLYLVCRFEGFDDNRSLALHRIQKAQASILGFERPGDFDLQRFDDEGRFGFGDGTRVRLSFRIKKDAGLHLLESRLSSDQQVVEHDDSYEISATVVDSPVLEWWLRGFGAAVSKVRRRKLMTARA